LQTVQTAMKSSPPSTVSQHSLSFSGHILMANLSNTAFYKCNPSRVPLQCHSETSITQLCGWY
jgi:hypothetical protein